MSKEPAFKNAKFEATGETKVWLGIKLHRIRAVADIAALGIVAGAIGGWIEKEENLSVSGDAWVYGNAQVYGDAWVYKVNLTMQRSDGYVFSVVATPDGPRIIAGCRYFTYADANRHWRETRGGTQLGDESLLIVKSLKAMAKLNGLDKPIAKAKGGAS